MIWTIYAIVRHQTGEVVYVGQCSTTLKKRWAGHVHKPTGAMYSLIQTEGQQAFIMDKLATANTKQEANELEAQWMQRMFAAGQPLVNRVIERTVKQLTGAEQLSPIIHTAVANEKRRRPRTAKEKAHLSATCTNKHAVICLNTGEVFPSVKAAAVYGNCAPPNVYAVLAGKARTAGLHPVTSEPLGWVDANADAKTVKQRQRQLRAKLSKPSSFTRSTPAGGHVDVNPWWLMTINEDKPTAPRVVYQLVDKFTGKVRAVGHALANCTRITDANRFAAGIRNEHSCVRAGQAVDVVIVHKAELTQTEAELSAYICAMACADPLLNTEIAHWKLVNGKAVAHTPLHMLAAKLLARGMTAKHVITQVVSMTRRQRACLQRFVARLTTVLDITHCGGNPLAVGKAKAEPVVCLNVDRVYASQRVAAEALSLTRADVHAAISGHGVPWRLMADNMQLVLVSLRAVIANLNNYRAWADSMLNETMCGTKAAKIVDTAVNKHWRVYTVAVDGQCVYVGQTNGTVRARIDAHVKSRDAVGKLIKANADNVDVRTVAVIASQRAALVTEKKWIAKMLNTGRPLVNIQARN